MEEDRKKAKEEQDRLKEELEQKDKAMSEMTAVNELVRSKAETAMMEKEMAMGSELARQKLEAQVGLVYVWFGIVW